MKLKPDGYKRSKVHTHRTHIYSHKHTANHILKRNEINWNSKNHVSIDQIIKDRITDQ